MTTDIDDTILVYCAACNEEFTFMCGVSECPFCDQEVVEIE